MEQEEITEFFAPEDERFSALPVATEKTSSGELRKLILTHAAVGLSLSGGDRPDTGFETVFWAWARVSSAVDFRNPREMTPGRGCVPAGAWVFPGEVTDYASLSSRRICRMNGEAMYRAYAETLPADALVTSVTGEVLLLNKKPSVVYAPDGAVDPEASALTFLKPGGTSKKTFYALEREGFLPFRLPELAGVRKVSSARVKGSLSTVKPAPERFQMEDLRAATLTADRPILRVEARAEAEGKEVFRVSAPVALSSEPRRFRLSELDLPLDLAVPEAQVTVTAALSNGETKTAFCAPLMKAPPVPKIPRRVTAADFDAIPTARPGMTEDELRAIIVRCAKLQTTLPWTPSDTFYYHCADVYENDVNGNLSFRRGAVYGGMPYSPVAFDAYAFLDRLDENAVLDVKKIGMGALNTFGNHCSGMLFWSFAHVSSRMTYVNADTMVPRNGCLPLGAYRIDGKINAHREYGTRRICEENGEQTMYEAYALLKPADGVIYGKDGYGHACMAAAPAHTVRREDGTIDGEASFIDVFEQHTPRRPRETEYGTVLGIDGPNGNRLSFAKCFARGCLPFRIPEFCGQPIEKVRFSFGKDLARILTAQELRALTLTSNYPISQVWITVTPPDGEKVTVTVHGAIKTARSIAFSGIGIPDTLPYGKLEIKARAGTGEIRVLFSGRLERF